MVVETEHLVHLSQGCHISALKLLQQNYGLVGIDHLKHNEDQPHSPSYLLVGVMNSMNDVSMDLTDVLVKAVNLNQSILLTVGVKLNVDLV
jgi:hypothetical protein